KPPPERLPVTCVILLSWPALSWAADAKATATARQGDRELTFEGGLGTDYEGLVVALLGSCNSESGATIATKERWEKALQGTHLRIRFAKARVFGVTAGEPPQVKAEEIVVPISASQSSDHIFVRSGKSYRAFAKYEPKMCFFIQDRLKLL